ncbi:lipopolysaccharide biosynthesis protein RfbH [Sedimentibacter sp.]|uniref:lipopolysaccharide biosynthesis protein RfbH n=1 Tax=Sedimentibacter sp. TaxID=1960295 RepID=UPI00289E3D0E|nr:lipopolysaccharide biosynthesis protein RfbH [Sedimentibacter sp.]
MRNSDKLKHEIMNIVKDYYFAKLDEEIDENKNIKINYAGRVYDEREILNLVDSSLEFWLTAGKYAKEFEYKLAEVLDVKFCYACNSGSSANLLAFMALTSPLLNERKINRGDEVITVAAGFPTTVAPIIQYGAIPVFVDITIPQYNIDINELENALNDKTKAVMIAHTLGNPFDIYEVKRFCEKHNLWLIEDNCDSLGSEYYIDGSTKYTGTIGDIGTSSFYPPHHITMGEGGAVYTNNPLLAKIMLSMRDWGRDCSCPSGMDNKCGNRFANQYGELPYGYDHKYVYSHFGYNLKITDLQAAVGCAQLEKLISFKEARIKNWNYLKKELEELDNVFILPEPNNKSVPNWFGFFISIKENAGFSRNEIVEYLEKNNIQTRMLFAGNIILHPCFDHMRKEESGFRQVGSLKNTNYVMNNSFWIGVYPGMTEEMLSYMVQRIKNFVKLKQ